MAGNNNSNASVKKMTFNGVEDDFSTESIIGSAEKVGITELRDSQGLSVGDVLGSFGKVISVAPMENNENARIVRFEDGHVISTTCACWNANKAYSFANEADKESFKSWVRNYQSPYKTEKQFLASTTWKNLKVKDIKSFKLVAGDGKTEYNKNFVMFG